MCNGQQCKRNDLRSTRGDSARRAATRLQTKIAVQRTGIRFEFAAAEFGNVLPHSPISGRLAAELHSQCNEIRVPPLIREPLPCRGDSVRAIQ